ncbi:MAG: hypothetical protein FWD40_08470 [Treponema sp.]|nr:hypothetical protein [Treponema sp.]
MSGKGGNNRKNRQGLQNKTRFSGRREDTQKHAKKHTAVTGGENLFSEGKFEKNRSSPHDRPQWTAPELPASSPITTPDCSWCGKQINDITTAICDKDTGRPVHFDCVLARISEIENLDTNDSVCYIGGGRFGIIHYNNPPDMRDFTIKKIYEWEVKDVNSEWRRPISEYFSIT